MPLTLFLFRNPISLRILNLLGYWGPLEESEGRERGGGGGGYARSVISRRRLRSGRRRRRLGLSQ